MVAPERRLAQACHPYRRGAGARGCVAPPPLRAAGSVLRPTGAAWSAADAAFEVPEELFDAGDVFSVVALFRGALTLGGSSAAPAKALATHTSALPGLDLHAAGNETYPAMPWPSGPKGGTLLAEQGDLVGLVQFDANIGAKKAHEDVAVDKGAQVAEHRLYFYERVRRYEARKIGLVLFCWLRDFHAQASPLVASSQSGLPITGKVARTPLLSSHVFIRCTKWLVVATDSAGPAESRCRRRHRVPGHEPGRRPPEVPTTTRSPKRVRSSALPLRRS